MSKELGQEKSSGKIIGDNQKQNHPPSDNPNKDELHSDKKTSLDTEQGIDLITPTQTENTRQVIAVSASKGPAAFFNLARKFLVTDETCDLSALEGAIISAVDAAHLLERSKLAKIIRIQTSYVAVEPKRRRPSPVVAAAATSPNNPSYSMPFTSPHHVDPSVAFQAHHVARKSSTQDMSHASGTQVSSHLDSKMPAYGAKARHIPPLHSSVDASTQHQRSQKQQPRKEVRRARIIITVKRTDAYTQWLSDNPTEEHDAESHGNVGEGRPKKET
eukprot:CAMPEP_0194361638 /NCGR_PEP_ID=MMETSP0174-20130528/9185_1 /TAXON_ID=216777 /ORGANISM="Proboscia alata, Strain PI-D3" /LENGTH=273 /DNA_ID=CAMNT_0039133919 /DNA_START=166 /DNA_END=987 /DNA_ORIENTATION=-